MPDRQIRKTSINRGTTRLRFFNKVIADEPVVGEEFGQLVLQIKFTKGKGSRKQVVVVVGQSPKEMLDNDDALFDGAFKSCLAQIPFSYDTFEVLDRAFVMFIPIQKTVEDFR